MYRNEERGETTNERSTVARRSSPPSRLVILSCTQRKNSLLSTMPAVERYDGPLFRVLRKFLRSDSASTQALDMAILSAEFGLVSGEQPIPDYDRPMTWRRAEELRPAVLSSLAALLKQVHYTDILISLGSKYMAALAGYEALIPSEVRIRVLTGSQGRRQADLYSWLYGVPMVAGTVASRRGPASATLRGVVVTLATDEVLRLGREALEASAGRPDSYQAWCVEIGDQRVSPKWLASQITGLSSSAFGTSEARRLLAQLGVEVKRV